MVNTTAITRLQTERINILASSAILFLPADSHRLPGLRRSHKYLADTPILDACVTKTASTDECHDTCVLLPEDGMEV
jgi:hypothetical protein